MSACPDWLHEVSAYLDGALTSEAEHRVQAHLGTCTECANYLVELVPVVQTLRELPDLVPSRDMWPMLSRELAATAPYAGAPQPGRVRQGLRQVGLVLVALGVAILLALVAWASWQRMGQLPAADERVYWQQHRLYAQEAGLPALYAPELRAINE